LKQTAGQEVLKIHNLQLCVECLQEQRKRSLLVPSYSMQDADNCSSYKGISISSTSYKFTKHFSGTPALLMNEIINDHQCGNPAKMNY
jgi:hypothetical protein